MDALKSNYYPINSHIAFFINLSLNDDIRLQRGDVLSVLDKAKKKTEEGAKNVGDKTKDLGQNAEDEAKKAARKVSG